MSKFWKSLIAIIILVTISVVSTIGIVKYVEKKKNEEEVILPNIMFQIGEIDTVGNVIESNTTFVTKELVPVEAIPEISLNKGATIYYKVAFYDLNKNFISVTEKLTGSLEEYPEGAKYLMIEFTPLNQSSVTDSDFTKFYNMLNLNI